MAQILIYLTAWYGRKRQSLSGTISYSTGEMKLTESLWHVAMVITRNHRAKEQAVGKWIFALLLFPLLDRVFALGALRVGEKKSHALHG